MPTSKLRFPATSLKGKISFADRQVDVRTVRLAGLFPNPGNTLRPDQFTQEELNPHGNVTFDLWPPKLSRVHP